MSRGFHNFLHKVEGQVRITSASDLEERYGHSMAHYAVEHPTPFKLCKALRDRDPPICIDDSIAKEWLRTYGGQLDDALKDLEPYKKTFFCFD